MSSMLIDLGCEVLLAGDGLQAIDVFQKSHHDLKLVLLDVIMPEMNGRDCLKELQKIDSSVPVLLSSGFTREEDLEELRDLGSAGLIRKPYHTASLSQKISEVLSQKKC